MVLVVREVASGADRHLDIGLQVVEAHPLFPYIPTSLPQKQVAKIKFFQL